MLAKFLNLRGKRQRSRQNELILKKDMDTLWLWTTQCHPQSSWVVRQLENGFPRQETIQQSRQKKRNLRGKNPEHRLPGTMAESKRKEKALTTNTPQPKLLEEKTDDQ